VRARSNPEAASLWVEVQKPARRLKRNHVGPSLIDLLNQIERSFFNRVDADGLELHLAQKIEGFAFVCDQPCLGLRR